MSVSSVDAILARLTALHPKLIDLSLDRMRRILDALDHPERKLPPVIHVAGTNGKGSTIAFMRAICEAAGLRVHVYTSPHLVRFNERFRLAGLLVSDDELAGEMEDCERANQGQPITVFEMTTAVGFMLFAKHPADVLLLEVGLGGRLDATNVIDAPLVSVITSLSMDHRDFLGDTIQTIAAEKAGILKRGVPAVSAVQPREALAVLERQAARVGASLQVAGEHFHIQDEHGRLVFHDDDGLLDLPAPRLFGRHQIDNAGLAIAALRRSGLALPHAAFEHGLTHAEWPARMQRLSQGTLPALLSPGSELWLDGGHNDDGGRAIAAALCELEERVSRPLVVVAGMLATKDHAAFLRHFAGLSRALIAITIPDQPNALPADTIRTAARDAGLDAQTTDSVDDALRRVAAMSFNIPPRVLITGSLYLAGAVLAHNGTPPT